MLTKYDQLQANPVSNLLLVKNQTKNLDILLKTIKNLTENTQDLETDIDEKFNFPSKTDVRMAIRALIKLGDVYDIQPMQFSSGNIHNNYFTEKLNGLKELCQKYYIYKYLFVLNNIVKALDCFEIGELAYNEKDYYHAALWFGEALTLYSNEKLSSSANLKSILNYLSSSLKHVIFSYFGFILLLTLSMLLKERT